MCWRVCEANPPACLKPPRVCVCACAELEEEASRPGKDSKTLSSDLIDYVEHMIRQHGDDYKVSGTSRLHLLFTQLLCI